jgi:hypothetical protein
MKNDTNSRVRRYALHLILALTFVYLAGYGSF